MDGFGSPSWPGKLTPKSWLQTYSIIFLSILGEPLRVPLPVARLLSWTRESVWESQAAHTCLKAWVQHTHCVHNYVLNYLIHFRVPVKAMRTYPTKNWSSLLNVQERSYRRFSEWYSYVIHVYKFPPRKQIETETFQWLSNHLLPIISVLISFI